MKYKSVMFSTLIFLISFEVQAAGNQQTMEILFTASLNGALEGCYCEETPVTGLSVIAGALKEEKSAGTFLIDLGDWNSYPYNPQKSAYLLTAFSYVSYDMVLVGDQDISVLLNEEPTEKFIMKPVNMKLSGGMTDDSAVPKDVGGITFIPVLDPHILAFYPEELQSAVIVEDIAATINEAVLRSEKGIIILYHGLIDNLKSALSTASTEGIICILAAHEQRTIENFDIEGIPVFSPGPRGNNVGRILVNKDTGAVDYQLLTYNYGDRKDPVVQRLTEEYKNSRQHLNK